MAVEVPGPSGSQRSSAKWEHRRDGAWFCSHRGRGRKGCELWPGSSLRSIPPILSRLCTRPSLPRPPRCPGAVSSWLPSPGTYEWIPAPSRRACVGSGRAEPRRYRFVVRRRLGAPVARTTSAGREVSRPHGSLYTPRFQTSAPEGTRSASSPDHAGVDPRTRRADAFNSSTVSLRSGTSPRARGRR